MLSFFPELKLPKNSKCCIYCYVRFSHTFLTVCQFLFFKFDRLTEHNCKATFIHQGPTDDILNFPRKLALTYHANFLQQRQFAFTVKPIFGVKY